MTALSEAELHGLIDGQIDMQHRADILRRAARSAADRERIAAWQQQGEMIRSAFAGIAREPLPGVLDLRAPARLHVLAAAPLGSLAPLVAAPDRRRSRNLAPMLATLVACAGVGATWLAGGFTLSAPPVERSTHAGRVAAEVSPASGRSVAALPTTVIPDVTSLGFAFVRAEARNDEPTALVFHYRDALAGELSIAVTRAIAGRRAITAERQAIDDALAWQAGTRTYALAGTLNTQQLRELLAPIRDLTLVE